MDNFLLSSPNSVRGAYVRTRCLEALKFWTIGDFVRDRVIADVGPLDFSELHTFSVVPGTTLNRQYFSWFLARAQGVNLLFIGGAEAQWVGQQVWEGYTGAANVFGPSEPPHNWFCQQVAQFIHLEAEEKLSAAPTICVTYSAGGVVGWELARLQFPMAPLENTWDLITFGCPKLDSNADLLGAEVRQVASWMNSDDPVPLLPPNPGTWDRVMSGLSRGQGLRIGAFRTNPNGINVRPDGSFRPGNLPLDVTQPPVTALGQWLSATQAGALTSHAITSYVARLSLLGSVGPEYIADTGGTVSGGDYDPAPTPSRVRAAEEQAAQTIFSAADRQAGKVVKIPVDNAFTVKRIGRVYWVLFRQVPIVAAPYRKRAHGLAHAGNNWLRRLQKEAYVDTDTLQALLAAYIDDATDPSGNFVPPMNNILN